MADVTLTYKGNTIAELDDSGSKTIRTAGKFCEADIGVEYVKPAGGGADPIHMSQYTLTGDTTIGTFLRSIQYAVHSDNCLIIIRSSGDTAPGSGSYTMNNFIAGFHNGSRVQSSHLFARGQTVPKNMQVFPGENELDTSGITISSGILTSSYTGTSCIGTAGAAVTLVEIELPDNFWAVLNATSLLGG